MTTANDTATPAPDQPGPQTTAQVQAAPADDHTQGTPSAPASTHQVSEDAEPGQPKSAAGPVRPTTSAHGDTKPANLWSTASARRQTRPAPAASGDADDDWWTELYQHQDADLDTNTGQPRHASGRSVRDAAGSRPAQGEIPAREDQADPEQPAEPWPGNPNPMAPAPAETLDRTAAPGDLDEPRPRRQHIPAVTGSRRLRKFRTPFWRFCLFSGSAAATGYAVGLGAYLSQFPPAAVQAAGGLLALAVALVAGATAWKAAGTKIVADFLPFGALGRLALVVAAAEIGRRLGPAALPFAAEYTKQYLGLDQEQTALLITGLFLCGGTGWLTWRVRGRSLLVRWFAHIPFATAVLVCALYTNGPVA